MTTLKIEDTHFSLGVEIQLNCLATECQQKANAELFLTPLQTIQVDVKLTLFSNETLHSCHIIKDLWDIVVGTLCEALVTRLKTVNSSNIILYGCATVHIATYGNAACTK